MHADDQDAARIASQWRTTSEKLTEALAAWRDVSPDEYVLKIIRSQIAAADWNAYYWDLLVQGYNPSAASRETRKALGDGNIELGESCPLCLTDLRTSEED